MRRDRRDVTTHIGVVGGLRGSVQRPHHSWGVAGGAEQEKAREPGGQRPFEALRRQRLAGSGRRRAFKCDLARGHLQLRFKEGVYTPISPHDRPVGDAWRAGAALSLSACGGTSGSSNLGNLEEEGAKTSVRPMPKMLLANSALRFAPSFARRAQPLDPGRRDAELFAAAIGASRRRPASKPSRSSGRILRPSCSCGPATSSSARALIVIGPSRMSLARIENWVARKPAAARCWS